MTQYDASVIRTGPRVYVKIYEDGIVHCFDIQEDVDYQVTRPQGELITPAHAELVDLQQDACGNVRSVVLRTLAYDFEVRSQGNSRFIAYRSKRHQKMESEGMPGIAISSR